MDASNFVKKLCSIIFNTTRHNFHKPKSQTWRQIHLHHLHRFRRGKSLIESKFKLIILPFLETGVDGSRPSSNPPCSLFWPAIIRRIRICFSHSVQSAEPSNSIYMAAPSARLERAKGRTLKGATKMRRREIKINIRAFLCEFCVGTSTDYVTEYILTIFSKKIWTQFEFC